MAKIEVIVDANDVIRSFNNLELRKQDGIIKTAYIKGAEIIRKGVQFALIREFKGNMKSQKVSDMVESIGHRYNKEGQYMVLYPIESTDCYFSFMTKWFIAGTKNRKTYDMATRERKNGNQTKRLYKSSSRRSYGKIKGNNAIEEAYNANYRIVNVVIKDSIEKQLIKMWKKNG